MLKPTYPNLINPMMLNNMYNQPMNVPLTPNPYYPYQGQQIYPNQNHPHLQYIPPVTQNINQAYSPHINPHMVNQPIPPQLSNKVGQIQMMNMGYPQNGQKMMNNNVLNRTGGSTR